MKRTLFFIVISVFQAEKVFAEPIVNSGGVFSIKGGYEQGYFVMDNTTYQLRGMVGLVELGFRAGSFFKLTAFGVGDFLSVEPTSDLLNQFHVGGYGMNLRLFFLSPIFVEGGGGARTFNGKSELYGSTYAEEGYFWHAGAGVEIPLNKFFTFEITFRHVRMIFQKKTFTDARLTGGLAGLNVYW